MAGWCISHLTNFLWLRNEIGFILDVSLFVFFFLFCSISHVEMNVILHFIYGGTLDFPDKVDVGYMSTFIIVSLCLFCVFSVKSQKENSSCTINKTKMSSIMIITPKHTCRNSKNKAVEVILFIWQLLEKVGQIFLEYYIRTVKNRRMFYTKTIPSLPVPSF